jgi:hypothetical protein
MACKGSGVQIPSAPPGTTHLPLTLAASFASNLPAKDVAWLPQHLGLPAELVGLWVGGAVGSGHGGPP